MITRRFALYILFLLLLATSAVAADIRTGPSIVLNAQAMAGPKVTVGQTVQISITTYDVDYVIGRDGNVNEQINDPVNINWQATGGTLTGVLANDGKTINLTWNSPTQPGNYAIFLTADDSGRYANDAPERRILEFAVEIPRTQLVPTIHVAANPQTIESDKNTATIITAQVLGKDVAGKTVHFFATDGTLSAAQAVTDANGSASVQLTVNRNSNGSIEVAAYYGNTTSTTDVEITDHTPAPRENGQTQAGPPLPPYDPDFTTRVSPSTLPADGRSTANVTVCITDARGLGISGKIVEFSISGGGIIGRRSMTDRNGYATVPLTASDQPGTALIFAAVGSLRSYTRVTYTAARSVQSGQPHLYLSVSPVNIPADGVSKLLVQILALDSDGYPLRNTAVDFSCTLGTVQYPRIMTTSDGRGGTYITAPTVPGLATVTARMGNITAATQVGFQGQAIPVPNPGPANWTGQKTYMAADGWLYRQVQVTTDKQNVISHTLMFADGTGQVTKQLDLGNNAMLVHDQYGAAHGYGVEEGNRVKVELLKPDGSSLRTTSVNLILGKHLVDLCYAEPAGNLLVTLANSDGTKPELHYFTAAGAEVIKFTDGLDVLPITALSGDGYLAMAFSGGSQRLYSPQGDIVSEPRRTDGLPATQIAVGPNGSWVAVASALDRQTEYEPRLTVFSRLGAMLFSYKIEALQLAPAGKDGLVIGTPSSTQYLNLMTRAITWNIPGCFDNFAEAKGIGVIAGQWEPKTYTFMPRVTIIRLTDGVNLYQRDLTDVSEIIGLLPSATNNQIGVITGNNVLRFPLPQGN
ncbi:MAG TPA: Ig-like domain-containing protein [Armatimonadota bacterium]|nr:Ig-like domain-containing protein [Armatimonadota bacterium]